MKIVIDKLTNKIVGLTSAEFVTDDHKLMEYPANFIESELDLWYFDGENLLRDASKVLVIAKAERKIIVKKEAAQLIAATDWKLSRAKERQTAGWGSLAEIDAVLTEREAIRRSSDIAEHAIDALETAYQAEMFQWSVTVAVAAPKRLTHVDFMKRFSDDEIESVLEAAKTNAALNAFWEKFRLAGDVNLLDPMTIAGVQALEIATILNPGRAEEILA
jgi:hypothetical protein